MAKKQFLLCLLTAIMICSMSIPAHALTSLSMDSPEIAPAPKDECFLSDREYLDSTIHVVIDEGTFKDVHYYAARIKITHPSQLRTVCATQVRKPDAEFEAWSKDEAKCGKISEAGNAVLGINGDYYSIPDHCQIALRQSKQVRNRGNGTVDILIVDRNGDFRILPKCSSKQYIEYFDAHADEMYQVFCFGPTLMENGIRLIDEKYRNGSIIADKKTQRVAIAQIGTLEYMIIVCDGDALFYKFGLTVYEFSLLCEEIQNRIAPDSFRVVYGLDGGNSASLTFKVKDGEGNLNYQKLNMPERERTLSDMICFVSLED